MSKKCLKPTGKAGRIAKKPIKKVVFVYRPRKPRARKLGQEIVTWLGKKGVEAFTHPDQKPIAGTKSLSMASLGEIDLAIVLGGDGTYLNAIRLIDGSEIPVLGINLGSLGFLTEIPSKDAFASLEKVLSNQMMANCLTMLRVTVKRKGMTPRKYYALNDVVIERGEYSRLVYLSIKANDQLVTNVKADGIIVSSPTGSTAYNLASGGPIVHPDVSALVVTPICAHSLTNRPIVLPDNQKIVLRISQATQTGIFMVDGQRCEDITKDDEITITKAKRSNCRLSRPDHDYFDLLSTKLNFGHRD